MIDYQQQFLLLYYNYNKVNVIIIGTFSVQKIQS